jgi:radical SAM protein with 4Fe4S-binding SPASM domain
MRDVSSRRGKEDLPKNMLCMPIEEAMSFLFCDIDLDPPGKRGLAGRLSVLKENLGPYVKELTFRCEDPSLPAGISLLDDIEAIGIPFAIRSGGQWSDPEAFLDRASRASLMTSLIISDFDERFVKDSSKLGMSFFNQLKLFSLIREAGHRGIPVKTVTPVDDRTERDLEDILKAAFDCGAVMAALERQREVSDSDSGAWREKYRRILARMRAFRREGWPVAFEGCMPLCAGREFYRACGAGVISCFIRSDGEVYVCRRGGISAGSIMKASLHSLYQCDELHSWRSRMNCQMSQCEVRLECRGGCPFQGGETGMDLLADPSSMRQSSTFDLPISMDEALAVKPHFEMRRGRDGVFALHGRDYLIVRPAEESLIRFLLGGPSLRDVAWQHGEGSLRDVFSLYVKGFVSFESTRSGNGPFEIQQQKRIQRRELIDFDQNLLIRLSFQAEFTRRGNTVLVMHPPSLSFNFLPLSLCYLVKGLAEPCYFDGFLKVHAWLGREAAENLVRNLYAAGVVEINGVGFWSGRVITARENETSLECFIQCRDENGAYMGKDALAVIIESVYSHYSGRRKSFVLVSCGNDEEMPDWLDLFSHLKSQCNSGDGMGCETRIVLDELPLPDEMTGALKRHSVKLELPLRDDSEVTLRQVKSMCSQGVDLILTVAAETPEAALKQLRRFADSGASAFRLELSFNHRNMTAAEGWVRAYVKLFDELYGPGRTDRNASPRVVEFDWLIESMRLKRRKGGACSTRPCGAGVSRIAYDLKGNLFPCHSMFGMEEFSCGRAGPEEEPGKRAVKQIERILGSAGSSSMRCHDCRWTGLCPGGCPSAYRKLGLSFHDPDPDCGFKKNMMLELTGRIASLMTAEKQASACTGDQRLSLKDGQTP